MNEEAPFIKTMTPRELGWKRRGDLEEGLGLGARVYEALNGKLHIMPWNWQGYIQVLDGDVKRTQG